MLLAALLLAAPVAFCAQFLAGASGRGGGINTAPPPVADFNDHTGFAQIFDGATLNGWDGDPNVWKIVNGAVAGYSLADKPVGT